MGLTEAEGVFGGVTEDAMNDLLRAYFNARPRHLRYGSPAFVPNTSPAATTMPAIAFPGVPGGIDWSVEVATPTVDLHPQTVGLPPELNLAPGQLSISTAFRLCISCERQRDPRDGKDEKPTDEDEREDPNDWRGKRSLDNHFRRNVKATCFSLRLYGTGHIERILGLDSLRISVDDVEIVDIEPSALESVLECLMLQVLRAVLANVLLPLETLRAGAFSLSITRGPEIEDDTIKTYGNL